MGSWEVAARLAALAVDARPDCVDSWLRLALAQERIGRPHQSAQTLETALERFPDNAALFNQVARIWYVLHDFERAFDAQGRWQAAHPDDREAIYRRFLLLVRSGRNDEAAELLDDVAANFPVALGVIETKFRGALQSGAFDAVIEYCDRVLGIDPGHADALFFKAWSLDRMGRSHEARAITDVEPLVRVSEMDTPAGYADMAEFLAELSEEIGRNPTLTPDPISKPSRNGAQALNLLQPENRAMGRLIAQIQCIVEAYARDNRTLDSSWARAAPRRARLRCWATLFDTDGFHVSHRHPGGWLSGVFYVAAPQRPDGSFAGALTVGTGFRDTPEDQGGWIPRTIEPVPGRVALFPSFVPHRTEPPGEPGQRIAVAFDVHPA